MALRQPYKYTDNIRLHSATSSSEVGKPIVGAARGLSTSLYLIENNKSDEGREEERP